MISTTILLSTLKDDFNYTTTLHPKGRFQLHYCSPPQRTISTTLLLSTLKDDFNYTTALHPRGRFQLHYCYCYWRFQLHYYSPILLLSGPPHRPQGKCARQIRRRHILDRRGGKNRIARRRTAERSGLGRSEQSKIKPDQVRRDHFRKARQGAWASQASPSPARNHSQRKRRDSRRHLLKSLQHARTRKRHTRGVPTDPIRTENTACSRSRSDLVTDRIQGRCYREASIRLPRVVWIHKRRGSRTYRGLPAQEH